MGIEIDLAVLIATVIAGATPVLLATLGETISEKAGIINLSLDGTIMLSAMTAFVVAFETHSLILGFLSAGVIGALLACTVAYFSIYLRQSQVAVGFVLTLMARDLAYFLGNPYCRIQGPQVAPSPIPLLHKIPFVGQVLFSHGIHVYLGILLIGFCWWYLYRTPRGLRLRSVGEHPEASYARGIDPRKLQMIYTVCGGALVGLAGAAFSLSVKPGWGRPQGAEGTGWIALALVIFGGWHPVRAAVGAYLFSFLQVSGICLQGWIPSVPAQVFQVAPFPLMIFTLVLLHVVQRGASGGRAEQKGWLKPVVSFLSGARPAALGRQYMLD